MTEKDLSNKEYLTLIYSSQMVLILVMKLLQTF